MASQKKVRWAELRSGIVAATAMVIAGVLIFLLSSQGSLFVRNFHLKTYLDDSEGLNENDPVRVNGILVGYIKVIRLSGSRDPKRTVELDMMIQEKFLDQIPEDSKAAISSANLLGSKYLYITKGTHPKHVEPGGEVGALPNQGIPEIMAQSTNLLSRPQNILGRADGLLAFVENGQGNIGKLIKDDTLYDRLNATAGELQDMVKDVRTGDGTVSHLLYDPALYQDLRKPLQRMDDMLAQVQQGKGSVGKALYDPKLYDEALASITDVKQMLDELKGGQRHRREAAHRRRDRQPDQADFDQGEYHARQDQFGPGDDWAIGGQSAALRFAEWDDARSECAGEGCACESEEVSADQAGDFLGSTLSRDCEVDVDLGDHFDRVAVQQCGLIAPLPHSFPGGVDQ